MFRQLIVLFLFFMAGIPMLQAQCGSQHYCNSRYAYCINYDPELLIRQPEAQNGDGCTFTGKEGKVKLSVYGTGNWTYTESGAPLSLKQLYELELRGVPSPKLRIAGLSVIQLSIVTGSSYRARSKICCFI
jgi:hypothetical protein